MSDSIINAFTKGTWNLGDDKNIPKDAAQSSNNWLTQDGRLKLITGRLLVGAEGTVGKISGLHYGYKVKMIEVEGGNFAVDVPSDIPIVEMIMKERGIV